MSGHSKWATTKRHKAAVDAKRGKIFSSLSKEITLAARASGGDTSTNARLRTLIIKAKAANMPNDNIDRAVKKGTGEIPGVVYEEVVYEGYAAGGVGVVVTVTTDNKNRSTSEVRSVFTKHGGNLGSPGALTNFSFHKKGRFIISKEVADEEKLMEVALEAGAEDIKDNGDTFEVLSDMKDYDTISDALNKAGIAAQESALAWIPTSETPIADLDGAKKILKMIDSLEALDDVNDVYANFDISDELLAQLDA
ncbi:MAG TPA: YebC/PmpR family DNA-binding transcriptional regulator [Rhodoferax sp.]|nr:YebC/PmpR family DNA-binding transcriptional regulator [Rhodoferax sp.]